MVFMIKLLIQRSLGGGFMEKIIIDDYQIEKAYEDSQNDCMWRIRSLEDPSSEFVIHVSHTGQMYVTHFPNTDIPFKVRVMLFQKLCLYLRDQGFALSIKIVNRNQTLRNFCLAAGFKYKSHGPKKSYGIRHDKDFTIYYLPQ